MSIEVSEDFGLYIAVGVRWTMGFGLCGGQEGVDTAADEGRENEAGGNHADARYA